MSDDVMSVIGFGGENFVKTTVFPSGVNVDAKTSPVETIPGANMTAVSGPTAGVALETGGCWHADASAPTINARHNGLIGIGRG
jgi:hypothetical protein